MKDAPFTPERRWQTCAIFGASGAGKTTLSATAPKPYIADSNDGALSFSGRKGFEHVRGDLVRKLEDLDELYNNFTGTGDVDWRKKYRTLSLDHFDDIQGIILDILAENASKKDASREVDAIEQREYGIMGNKLRRYLRALKKLRMHKILVLSEATDFETGRLRPRLIGSMKGDLPYYTDHTMYLRIGKKNIRYLHLNSTEEFYAKTRAHWLPPEMRKIRVEFGDTTLLTRLFALIAAGPQGYVRAHKQFLRGIVPTSA
jgi:hypothetical protein